MDVLAVLEMNTHFEVVIRR